MNCTEQERKIARIELGRIFDHLHFEGNENGKFAIHGELTQSEVQVIMNHSKCMESCPEQRICLDIVERAKKPRDPKFGE